MKGVVFTELLEMVEDKFGFDVADQIVTETELPSGGIYTAVGTYEFSELVTLVMNLSKATSISPLDLQKAFGVHLFSRFSSMYGHFFEEVENAFHFLQGIENYIHVEVRKLYPDAELPSFDIYPQGEDKLVMEYSSERGMVDFAEGLIEGCLNHFEETADIQRTDVASDNSYCKFVLTRSMN
ncbi:MAG: heme NO-binding domain-containing protein [Bacteroidota bacterium]